MTIKLNPTKLAVLLGITLPLMINTTTLQAEATAATTPATTTATTPAPAKAATTNKVSPKKPLKQDVGDKALDDIYNQNE